VITATHSGPCIYCEHGPWCTDPQCTRGPVSGPVCGECRVIIASAEARADPYASGDYYAMFGDDE
jgi:hypothetical protein